jgi:glucokinase
VSRLAVGVDVGGTKLLAVLADHEGAVHAEARHPTPSVLDAPGVAVADAVAAVLADLHRTSGTDLSALPLGVGAPGMLDTRGVLVFSPNLPSLTGADLGGILAARLGRAAVLANDADAAAVAEHRLGAGRGADDVVTVTLGTGIGGAVIADGRLVRGRSGFAGEIGHVVVDPAGPRCPCGRRGCWERYASGAGVARLAREAATAGRLTELVARVGDPEAVRGEDVTHAAASGDRESLAVLDEVAWWLALGLANLTATLDPERFVVGGGLTAEAGELLLPAARRHLPGLLEGGERRPVPEVLAAELSHRAGAIGAALLAAEG